ncbi:MAG: hypothetical protein ACRDRO_12125 [Pseudonocardiaceae bacterium]
MTRNVPEAWWDQLCVHHGDVRFIGDFLPGDGVQFAFLGGNSLGDITDIKEHAEFIKSLAAALAPGGVLVFDYVGDRYAPGAEDGATEWPEIYHGDAGDIAVVDRGTRQVPGTAMSILHRTSEVRNAQTREPVVEAHAYDKLIAPDVLLAQQFGKPDWRSPTSNAWPTSRRTTGRGSTAEATWECWVNPTASTGQSTCRQDLYSRVRGPAGAVVPRR